MNSRNALLAAGLIAYATGAAAGMYRWVDKDGAVHYTQTPPPEFQAETVRPAPPPNPGSDALQKYSDAYQKREGERSKKQAELAAKKEQSAAQCAQAKQELEKLQSLPLNRLAEQGDDGNLIRMTPDKHAELVSAAQATINKNCGQ